MQRRYNIFGGKDEDGIPQTTESRGRKVGDKRHAVRRRKEGYIKYSADIKFY